MRSGLLAAFALLLASCGQPPGTAADPELTAQEVSLPQETLPRNTMAMRGVDLRMYDYTPTAGELRDPTFWIHADAGQLAEGEKVWSLQKTQAVIYREDEEDLRIEALEGQFDQERQEAMLKGAVRITTGTLVVDLEDVFWKNEEGAATTSRPIHLTNGDTRLDAKALRIEPKKGSLILRDGSGYVPLKEVIP